MEHVPLDRSGSLAETYSLVARNFYSKGLRTPTRIKCPEAFPALNDYSLVRVGAAVRGGEVWHHRAGRSGSSRARPVLERFRGWPLHPPIRCGVGPLPAVLYALRHQDGLSKCSRSIA